MNSDCREIRDRIADIVTGVQTQVHTVEQHMAECAACRDYERALKTEDAMLTRLFAEVDADMAGRQERLLQAIDRSCPTGKANYLIIGRAIMKSPITKLVAAAVLLLGLFILSRYLTGSENARDIEQDNAVATRQGEEQTDTTDDQELLANELDTAKQLFEKKDLPGLLELLDTGQEPIKVKVAGYLGQIGDSSVLSTLQTFAEQWQGAELENPFQKAIEAIRQRQDESEPEGTESNEEPNEPQGPPQASRTKVVGQVIDKDTARPLRGAKVGFRPTEAVATDAEGRFELAYTKTYQEAYVYATASGYASSRIMARLKTGDAQNVTIELSRGSKLAGRVTDPNSQAVQSAEVGVFGLTYPGAPTVTNAEGRFEIDGLNPVAHSYNVHVTHPAYPALSVSVQPAPAGQIQHQEFVLKRGVVVFGRVTGVRGRPVSGATVGNTRSGAMWNSITTKTDRAGMYRMGPVDTGELILWVTHPGYAPSVEHSVLATNPTERRIDIQLKAPCQLNGRVVDGDNEPVQGATVTISEYNGVRNLDRGRHSCDPDGRFVIPNSPGEGDLELRVFGEGISGKDHVVDFSLDECLIEVQRSGKIYGKVVDAVTGEPIANFLVRMTATELGPRTYGYSATWSREGYTFDSAEGLFDTGREALPIGAQFQITVSAEGYDSVILDPVLVQKTSDDPNRILFKLSPTSVFAGRVITSEGKPVGGADVVFFSNSNATDRDNWPRAVTDRTGIFTISELGSEPQCMIVSTAGFAPFVSLMSELIEAPGQIGDIVLQREAKLFGRVLDENGKGLENARVHAFVDLGRAREVLKRFPSLGPRARTDKDGHYQLSGVPTGQVQIGVQSPRNYTIGRKKIDLKPGDSKELNFGEEPGYVITGTVRAGGEVLERCNVNLYSREVGVRSDGTDRAGRFKVTHVPGGTYTLSVSWRASSTRGNTSLPPGTRFNLNRQLDVRKNMELNIDLADSSISGIGGGSFSGMIPEMFRSRENLRLRTMRLVTSSENGQTSQEWQPVIAPAANVAEDGQFELRQLQEGQYYLVLRDSDRTLARSEVFDIAESGDLDGVGFHYGNNKVLIHVVDAKTGNPIPNALFQIASQMQASFYDKRHTPGEVEGPMAVDENGLCLFDGLPDGAYQVKAQAQGYFLGESEWLDIAADQQTELLVRLEPAAMVFFEFAKAVLERATANRVIVSCKVTKPDTQTVVKYRSLWSESDHHSAVISLSESGDDTYSSLNLPEGTFDIEYTVRTLNVVDRVQVGPSQTVAEGKTTVTCQLGEPVTIVVTGQ